MVKIRFFPRVRGGLSAVSNRTHQAARDPGVAAQAEQIGGRYREAPERHYVDERRQQHVAGAPGRGFEAYGGVEPMTGGAEPIAALRAKENRRVNGGFTTGKVQNRCEIGLFLGAVRRGPGNR